MDDLEEEVARHRAVVAASVPEGNTDRPPRQAEALGYEADGAVGPPVGRARRASRCNDSSAAPRRHAERAAGASPLEIWESTSGGAAPGERGHRRSVDWGLIQRMVDRCLGRHPHDLAEDVRQEVFLAVLRIVEAGTPVQSWSGLISVLVRRTWSRIWHPPVTPLPFEPFAHEQAPRPADEAALMHAREILTDRQFHILERYLDSNLSRTALAREFSMSPTDLREVLRACAKRLQKSPPPGATIYPERRFRRSTHRASSDHASSRPEPCSLVS